MLVQLTQRDETIVPDDYVPFKANRCNLENCEFIDCPHLCIGIHHDDTIIPQHVYIPTGTYQARLRLKMMHEKEMRDMREMRSQRFDSRKRERSPSPPPRPSSSQSNRSRYTDDDDYDKLKRQRASTTNQPAQMPAHMPLSADQFFQAVQIMQHMGHMGHMRPVVPNMMYSYPSTNQMIPMSSIQPPNYYMLPQFGPPR